MVQRPLWFGSVSASMALGVLCGGALLQSALPVAAQPSLPPAEAAFAKDAPQAPELKQQVGALRSQLSKLARTQPEAVAPRVDEWLRAHPGVAWSDAASLWELKATAQHQQGQSEAALQTYRAALAGFDPREPNKAWAAANLLKGAGRMLLAQKDAGGAAQLLSDNWPLIALSNSNREGYAWRTTKAAVETYVQALDASGHKAQVADILSGHLLQSPSLLEFAKQDSDLGALLLDIITERLTKAGRGAEVASWGRLRYASCRYEVEALDGATLFLGRAWNDKAKSRQFGQAQREASAPNPLQAVEPPKLLASETGREFVKQRAGELEAELAQTGDAKLVPDLVSLYLASEQPGAAMAWAWRGAQADPGEPNSIGQVCRVFKAADLDLVRAGQFMAWSAGGKVENPVPQFLEGHADAADVGAAKLKASRERRGREKAALAGDWDAVRQAPRGVMLGLVNLGALKPHEANQAGALRVEDTIRLIDERRVRIPLSMPDREMIRFGLIEVLDEQLAAMPKEQWPTMTPWVQLELADGKRKRGDAGAIPLYEALIAAAEKRNENGFEPQSIVPLAHLAMFYSETRQHLNAAETWSRWKDVPTSDAWNAEWRISAARAYAQAGQPEKAKQLYSEIPQRGHGWYPVLALYDQAMPLIQQGEFAQAYALMSQPIEFTDDKNSGIVAQNAWLADLAYRQGDIEGAMQHAKLALASGKGCLRIACAIYTRWRRTFTTGPADGRTNPSKPTPKKSYSKPTPRNPTNRSTRDFASKRMATNRSLRVLIIPTFRRACCQLTTGNAMD